MSSSQQESLSVDTLYALYACAYHEQKAKLSHMRTEKP